MAISIYFFFKDLFYLFEIPSYRGKKKREKERGVSYLVVLQLEAMAGAELG